MQYLQLEHINKSYGDKVLFEDLSLMVSKGDKLALLAKNGSGKTTLLKVIAGEEKGEGELAKSILTKSVSVSFLQQEPVLSDSNTVLEEVLDSNSPALNAIKAYELAQINKDEEGIQAAISKIEDNKAWNIDAKVKEILSKLKMTNLEQRVSKLSGGERKRVALTKLLIQEPDFVIMDEPTNHLDVEMIEWLEQYFKSPNFTLLVVTHDRYFIEAVCNKILELDNGKLQSYTGGYSDYLEKKQLLLANKEIVHGKMKQLYKKELDWVRRQPKARGTKSKARVDSFGEIETTVKSHQQAEDLKIETKGTRLGAKIVELLTISKSFGDTKIVDRFLYKFNRNDRIGIVGPNGAGKTTFIKLLLKEMEPDAGKVTHGDTVLFGHYSQQGLVLKKDKRVIDVVRDIADYIPLEKGRKLTAEKMLENFLFDHSKQQVYASQLSGGERKRLYLLTVLMKNPNFLILDEPTNDLDIVTLNILEEYLFQFKGCVLVVSHDRYFMDRLVDNMFVFEGKGEIRLFNGNYTDYRASLDKDKNAEKRTGSVEQTASKEKSSNKNDYEKRKEIKNLEKSIEKHEDQKRVLEEKFADSDLNQEQIQALSTELTKIKTALSEKEMRWLELSEE